MKAEKVTKIQHLVVFIRTHTDWQDSISDIIKRNCWQDISSLFGIYNHKGEKGVCMDEEGRKAICLKNGKPYINFDPYHWTYWSDDV